MIVNPGNILPFYDNINEQWQYRYGHGWGIPASVETLIPFQVYVDNITVTDEEFWLVNVASGQMIPIPLSQTEKYCRQNRVWRTWTGLRFINGLECGLWYVLYKNSVGTYYSEVMDLQNIGMYESAGLIVASCSGGTFELVANDSIAGSVVDEQIDVQNANGSWTTLTTTNSYDYPLVVPGETGDTTVHFRRIVQSSSGSCLTGEFSLYVADVTDPCADYTFIETGKNNYYARPRRVEIQFWNDTDINGILYSQNYKQKVYVDAYFDFPENEVDRETIIDGYGQEVILSSNVRERAVFDFPYLPDFWIHPFANVATHDNKKITIFETDETLDMNEYQFSYSAMEEGYFSRGRCSYRKQQWYDTGCEENETLVTCP